MSRGNHEVPCAYCGFPVSASHVVEHETLHCCLGCRIAHSVSREGTSGDQPSWTLTRLGLAIFFAMNVMVCTLALWSFDIYAINIDEGASRTLFELLRFACLLCATPVLLLLGGPLAETAFASVRQGRPSTDVLLLLGVIAAFAYSTISLIQGTQHVYFEVACMILVAVTLGRWFEATGKLRASQALQSLQKLLGETAIVVRDGDDHETPIDTIACGELVRVLPGERLPVDGIIESIIGIIDDQIITGESVPREKEQGEEVFGGSLVLDRELLVRVTATTQQGTLQRMIQAVEEAAAKKSREQRLADRLATWFVPVVIAIALATLTTHWVRTDFNSALMASLSVVLIACPCALAIATPLTTWAAINVAARHQVLFRSGDALSQLARVTMICFDKTGTLTKGQVELAARLYDTNTSSIEVDHIAAELASNSRHPLSRGISSQVVRPPPCAGQAASLSHVMHHAGLGIVGESDSTTYYLGSQRFMSDSLQQMSRDLNETLTQHDADSQSIVFVGWDGLIRVAYLFREQLRDEATDAIARLRELDLELRILSGDRWTRASRIEEQLGVPTQGELLPTDKLEVIESLRKHTPVAMVGDGINDAPALVAADLGIAMGCGADISRDAADVCLLGDDLTRIAWSIELARETMRTIHRNLFWAFAYNIVGVALAAGGVLNPIVAAIAMVGSSLFVIGGSLRLSAKYDGVGSAVRSNDSTESTQYMINAERSAQRTLHTSINSEVGT